MSKKKYLRWSKQIGNQNKIRTTQETQYSISDEQKKSKKNINTHKEEKKTKRKNRKHKSKKQHIQQSDAT